MQITKQNACSQIKVCGSCTAATLQLNRPRDDLTSRGAPASLKTVSVYVCIPSSFAVCAVRSCLKSWWFILQEIVMCAEQ